MSGTPVHVVQLRLTDDEWNLVCSIAQLRQMTIEDLLREALRLSHHRHEDPPAHERSHLRLVGPRGES
jgi:hypothetical protein